MTDLPLPSRTIIATRSSVMAMAQTAAVAALLRQTHPGGGAHFSQITTTADRQLGSLDSVGGKSAWIRELDAALVTGRADLTVSWAKDLPGPHERGTAVVIGAVLARQDVRDAVVLPAELPRRLFASCGRDQWSAPSPPRRAAQLRFRFRQLTIRPLRSNLDTRIKRPDKGDEGLDALVLSFAGLQRLGRSD
ncbi:hypothetical protein [Streptomyces sp. NPDC048641]|uniref:hypothetical protein n=1 Tax=Streptomyces sp. NPDC048641 TaxID=3154825 RepID=UPI003449969F